MYIFFSEVRRDCDWQATPTERRRTALVACAVARTTLPPQLLAKYPSQLRGLERISGVQKSSSIAQIISQPYDSDSPFSLVAAALQAIPVLTATEKTGFDFTLYTGDLVSHDSEHQLSR